MKKYLFPFFMLTVLSAQSQNSCDTLTNLTPESPYYMYEFSSAWGYMGGHNGNNLAEWAEQFAGISGTFQDILILPGRAYAGSASSYITMRVHSGSTTPGAVLESKQVLINTLQVDQWNKISFDSPVTVSGGFFISFKLNYTQPQDTFVILSNSPKANNTAWIKYPMMGWMSYQTFMNGQLNTSFGIAALFCDSATTIPQYSHDDFLICFPNPCSDKLNVALSNPAEKIWIISPAGQKQEIRGHSGDRSFEINMSAYSAGVYYIVVLDKNGHLHQKKISKF
jgi:hypothetical protein